MSNRQPDARTRAIEAQVRDMMHALERQRRTVVGAAEDVRKARMLLVGILAVLVPQAILAVCWLAWAVWQWWAQ